MATFSSAIVGLDLGRTTGFCVGRPGVPHPRSLSVRLAKSGEDRTVAAGNLIAFLDEEFRKERPSLVVKEAPLSLQAFKTLNMGEPVVRMTYGLHCIVEGLCARFGIPWREQADSTIRKHFVGKGRMGTREETKRSVLERCWQLGYFPRSVLDEDRGDACAVWDWACAHLARVAPKELHFFRAGAAA